MTFLPAAPNSGLPLRRVDLEGKPEIEARVENVVEKQSVDHPGEGQHPHSHGSNMCSPPFRATASTNAVVELDANEPPIADGSAREYCKMIQGAGIVAQDESREPFSSGNKS